MSRCSQTNVPLESDDKDRISVRDTVDAQLFEEFRLLAGTHFRAHGDMSQRANAPPLPPSEFGRLHQLFLFVLPFEAPFRKLLLSGSKHRSLPEPVRV